MAKRKRSRFRTTVYATAALVLCVLPPLLMSSSSGGCQLDTSPRQNPRRRVESDDSDSGESHESE